MKKALFMYVLISVVIIFFVVVAVFKRNYVKVDIYKYNYTEDLYNRLIEGKKFIHSTNLGSENSLILDQKISEKFKLELIDNVGLINDFKINIPKKAQFTYVSKQKYKQILIKKINICRFFNDMSEYAILNQDKNSAIKLLFNFHLFAINDIGVYDKNLYVNMGYLVLHQTSRILSNFEFSESELLQILALLEQYEKFWDKVTIELPEKNNFLPMLDKYDVTVYRDLVSRFDDIISLSRCAQLGIALQLYYKKYNKFPDNLKELYKINPDIKLVDYWGNELKTKVASVEIINPIDRQKFIDRNDIIKVYSTGKNGKDEGGIKTNGKNLRLNDDLTFMLKKHK